MFYIFTILDTNATLAKIPDILQFSTGATSIPPLGSFQPVPSLEFLHHNGSKFPKANTCANILQLPVVHGSYEEFSQSMDFGIMNAKDSFGFQ